MLGESEKNAVPTTLEGRKVGNEEKGMHGETNAVLTTLEGKK